MVLRSVYEGPVGASRLVSTDDDVVRSFCVCGNGGFRSIKCSSVVWCLVPASIVIHLRLCGERMVPTPLNAVMMVVCVSWHAALCLLMH